MYQARYVGLTAQQVTISQIKSDLLWNVMLAENERDTIRKQQTLRW